MKIQIKEAAMDKKGWSLYRLAQALELPQQTVYSWANQRTQPSWESMDMLCTVLDCTLNDLFKPEYRDTLSPKAQLKKQRMSALAAVKSYKKLELEAGR